MTATAPAPLHPVPRTGSECPFCVRYSRHEYEPCPGLPVMRFEPLRPVTPGHMLFVPFQHVPNASAFPALTAQVFEAAARYSRGLSHEYNLITSAGPNASQSVYHLHVHYVPRRQGDRLHLPWTWKR